MGEAAGQDGAHVMSKEEFLAELEACLSDLSKEEQEEALAYYQDYLEEAGMNRMCWGVSARRNR